MFRNANLWHRLDIDNFDEILTLDFKPVASNFSKWSPCGNTAKIKENVYNLNQNKFVSKKERDFDYYFHNSKKNEKYHILELEDFGKFEISYAKVLIARHLKTQTFV